MNQNRQRKNRPKHVRVNTLNGCSLIHLKCIICETTETIKDAHKDLDYTIGEINAFFDLHDPCKDTETIKEWVK